MYPRVSLYAAILAAAGLPIYIHVPRYASVELGIGLGVVGTVLIVIRLIDLVQDPALGWMIDRWPGAQAIFAGTAAAGLAVGFPLLFALPHGVPGLVAVLILLFSAYSLGMILLYGRSATLAGSSDPQALIAVASWREAGMLAGVILAALAPSVLVWLGFRGYAAFGWLLGGMSLVLYLASAPIWRRPAITGTRATPARLLTAGTGRLLLLALVNSLPVAVTSTLFLFFVEDRLRLPGLGGPFLLLFFFAAFVSVPLWTRVAQRITPKRALLIAMPLSIAGFLGAAALPEGASALFALICVASGAALGADMVILPAMFSIALAQAGLGASEGFGIWSFAGKLGLALAAFALLPLLERAGFTPGANNTRDALNALNLSYAILPCALKALAFALVLTLPTPEPS